MKLPDKYRFYTDTDKICVEYSQTFGGGVFFSESASSGPLMRLGCSPQLCRQRPRFPHGKSVEEIESHVLRRQPIGRQRADGRQSALNDRVARQKWDWRLAYSTSCRYPCASSCSCCSSALIIVENFSDSCVVEKCDENRNTRRVQLCRDQDNMLSFLFEK